MINLFFAMLYIAASLILSVSVLIDGISGERLKNRFNPQVEISKIYVQNELKYRNNQLPETTLITNHFDGILKVSDITQNGYSLTYTKIPTGDFCQDFIYKQKAYFDTVNGNDYIDSSIENKIKSICNNGQDDVGVTFKLVRGEAK